MSIIKLGIECENLEDSKSRWGVGQITLNLLEEYAKNPELQKRFRLYLYFKERVPEDTVFKNSIFIKRVIGFPSFNIFYHILMPIRSMIDRLDYMFFPAYMLPPLYLGKSIVMLTDDVYYEYKYGNLPFRYKLAYRLFTNWAAIKADKVLAISETSKKELVKLYGIKSERIFVSYLGVKNPNIENLNSKQNLNSNDINSKKFRISDLGFRDYILYIGQMFPRRHARESILAFKLIALEFPDLKFILVGKDKYNPPVIEELIRQTNKELGSEKIMYHDYIREREGIYKLYAGARAFIYVSDREAFGLPPVEALSFGVPPIVMDNESSHELFGDYAFYSKDSDEIHIAEAIKKALTESEKIQRINNEGPEFVKKYSWKNFADNFFRKIES